MTEPRKTDAGATEIADEALEQVAGGLYTPPPEPEKSAVDDIKLEMSYTSAPKAENMPTKATSGGDTTAVFNIPGPNDAKPKG